MVYVDNTSHAKMTRDLGEFMGKCLQ